jgi:hypothetical protein
MRRLVEFQLEDGGSVWVEVDVEDDEYGRELVSGEVVPAKAAMSFEKAMDTVKPVAEAIIAKLRQLSEPPHEMEVEFGLKMSAEAGAFVAAAGVEANYKVTLTWKRPLEKEMP